MISNFRNKFVGIIRSAKRFSDDGHIIVLHKYNAIYFAIPKVANSSLKAVCVDLLDIDLPPGAWKPGVFNTDKFSSVVNRKDILLKKTKISMYKDYWKFCFVRNPWDRLVSCYSQKIRDKDYKHPNFVSGVSKGLTRFGIFRANMPFDEFVYAVVKIPTAKSERHFRDQYVFVTNQKNRLLVDFVGKFERLDEDFSLVCERLGLSGLTLPHLLRTEQKNYRHYYTKKLRNIVGDRYKKDIELFGYDF